MDLKKIGSFEAIALILIVTINSIISDTSQDIIRDVGSASIINLIYCTILALIFFFIIFKLFQKFNKEDIIDISDFLGGKLLKTIVGILFLAYFTFISSTILRSFTEMLKVSYFPETAITSIILFFIVTLFLSSKAKNGAIIKTNLILIPSSILVVLISCALTVKNFTFERVFPILGNGFNSTFLTGASNIFAFSGLAYLYFLMPYISSSKKATRIGIISIIISSIILFLSIASFLLAFPFVASTEEISVTLFSIRSASFGRFFERPESLFVLIWMLSIISYLCVTLMIIGSILSKLLDAHDSNVIRSVYVPIIFIVSLIPSDLSTLNFLHYTAYKFASLIVVFAVPLVILLLSALKKRKLEKGVSSV